MMLNNIVLPNLNIVPAKAGGRLTDELIRRIKVLYRLRITEGLRENVIQDYFQHVCIDMQPLINCELIIWRAYLIESTHVEHYCNNLLKKYGWKIPLHVIERYEQSLNIVAFCSFEILFSRYHPDTILLGKSMNNLYILAHWNINGDKPTDLKNVKSWLRTRIKNQQALFGSWTGNILKACDEHDKQVK